MESFAQQSCNDRGFSATSIDPGSIMEANCPPSTFNLYGDVNQDYQTSANAVPLAPQTAYPTHFGHPLGVQHPSSQSAEGDPLNSAYSTFNAAPSNGQSWHLVRKDPTLCTINTFSANTSVLQSPSLFRGYDSCDFIPTTTDILRAPTIPSSTMLPPAPRDNMVQDPAIATRRSRAETPRNEAGWKCYKDSIYNLYIAENRSLESTMERMKEDCGLIAE